MFRALKKRPVPALWLVLCVCAAEWLVGRVCRVQEVGFNGRHGVGRFLEGLTYLRVGFFENFRWKFEDNCLDVPMKVGGVFERVLIGLIWRERRFGEN